MTPTTRSPRPAVRIRKSEKSAREGRSGNRVLPRGCKRAPAAFFLSDPGEGAVHSMEARAMKIFVTGASGYIGQAMAGALARAGHEVFGLVEGRGGALGGLRRKSLEDQEGPVVGVGLSAAVSFKRLFEGPCHIMRMMVFGEGAGGEEALPAEGLALPIRGL